MVRVFRLVRPDRTFLRVRLVAAEGVGGRLEVEAWPEAEHVLIEGRHGLFHGYLITIASSRPSPARTCRWPSTSPVIQPG
jgi:hypothetical protein